MRVSRQELLRVWRVVRGDENPTPESRRTLPVICWGRAEGGQQMDPYLVEIAKRLDTLDDRREITEALDRLEFLYDALDSEQQDLASQLMGKLQQRLQSLD